MVDCTGKEIVVGLVVQISDAWSKTDNGMWLVDGIWTDNSCHVNYPRAKARGLRVQAHLHY